MPRPEPAGDLARVKSHEANSEWPSMVEVVCYWGPPEAPRKGRRRSVEIPADQFFGWGTFGAPMSGDTLIAMVNNLRRQGPKTETKG